MKPTEPSVGGPIQRALANWYLPIFLVIIGAALISGLAVKWLEVERLSERVEELVSDQKASLEDVNEKISQLKTNQVGPVDVIRAGYIKFNIEGLGKGQYSTQYRKSDYPVASIVGWHMSCGSSTERHIESLFLNPSEEGHWTIYIETTSKCKEISVFVAFAGKNLVVSDQQTRQDSFAFLNWRILTVLNNQL